MAEVLKRILLSTRNESDREGFWMARDCVAAFCSLIVMLAAAQPAYAQGGDAITVKGYPSRPIRLIVPYSTGGNADIVSRILVQHLGASLGQQVIVDNRPGTGGNAGAEYAARATPDGYNLLVGTNTHAINMSLYGKTSYDFARDLAPISLMSSATLVLIVHPSLPVKSVKQLIALARAKPGVLNYGSSGNGSTGHIATELFKTMANVDVLHVPYKGAAQVMTDLVGGQVQLMLNPTSSSMTLMQSGRVRGLAISSLKRSELAPGLPTIAESGLRGFDASIWQGILAPARTPPDIIVRLNREITALLAKKEIKDQLFAQSVDAISSTPEQFAAYIAAEIAKWAKVVKASNAKID